MIKKYISEIHKKPEAHRRKVAYVSSGVITFMIAIVWVTSFGYLHPLNPPAEEVIAMENTEVPGPFSAIGSEVANGYNAVRKVFGLEAQDGGNKSKNATATLEYIPD